MVSLTYEELKDKVLSLPYTPGVYIMKNSSNTVIYVGKAKKLKNRVSQYFQDSAAHTVKTRMMVSQIADFDYIIAASEFEALVLECTLIKQHQPKYNILLKDDKGYPYIRLDLNEAYPTFSMSGRRMRDNARYFGPYGGRSVTQQAINAISQTLKLFTCSRRFPKDIGKERPCLNYQIGNCDGWCLKRMQQKDYLERIHQAILLLEGRNKELISQLQTQMEVAAENLDFENAAVLRDRVKAISSLSHKQLVCSGAMADTDVVGIHYGLARTGFAVLHFISGNLIDKDIEIVETVNDESQTEILDTLVKQYYLRRGVAPKCVYLPQEIEDSDLFSELLLQQYGKKSRFSVPQRGDHHNLVLLANKNAKEEAERLSTEQERNNKVLELLGEMLSLPETPSRMEAYDISNLGNTDIVASMTVFVDGKPRKQDYKRFKLKNLETQDDYESMRQVLERRFRRFLDGDQGFAVRPDILLIDGGAVHADTVRRQLSSMGISIPIFGMVKDDRHRTRALVTPDGQEIGIQTNQAVFSLIGRIQEETHRFAITYQRQLRASRSRKSSLDDIAGIGEKRKAALLRYFKSMHALKTANVDELSKIVPGNVARSIYDYYHNTENEEETEE